MIALIDCAYRLSTLLYLRTVNGPIGCAKKRTARIDFGWITDTTTQLFALENSRKEPTYCASTDCAYLTATVNGPTDCAKKRTARIDFWLTL